MPTTEGGTTHVHHDGGHPQRCQRDTARETVGAIQNDPALATFRFRAHNAWLGGGHSRTSIQGYWGAGQEDSTRTAPFTLDGDEPPVLLGHNQAPNAVETVLHGLASCLAIGFAYNAAAQGIEVRSLEFDLEGELDLHGFLGLSEETRAGYQGITVTYRVDADATPEQIDELCSYVQRTSPVLDIISNPVPVTVTRPENHCARPRLHPPRSPTDRSK